MEDPYAVRGVALAHVACALEAVITHRLGLQIRIVIKAYTQAFVLVLPGCIYAGVEVGAPQGVRSE